MKHFSPLVTRLVAAWLASAGLTHAQSPPLLTTGVESHFSNQRTTLNRTTASLSSTVTVTVKNTSDRLLEAPLHAVVTFLPAAGSSLAGLTTIGFQGGIGQSPYQTFFKDLSADISAGLGVGAEVSFNFSFERPSASTVSYVVAMRGVRNADPIAVIGGPISGQQGVAVSFDATGSSDPDGDSLAFAWDFGDGISATGLAPQHIYSAPGLYTVTAAVSDGRGATGFKQAQVPIAPPGVFALGRTHTLDGNGHPLGAVTVTQTGPEGSSTWLSEAASGFTSLGGTPGGHSWSFARIGYLTSFRQATLNQGQVKVVAFPWLAAMNNIRTTLSLLNPTPVKSPAECVTLTVPPGAFEQVESVALTELHGQALPLPLPFGWSPLAAFHLDMPGVAVADVGVSVKLLQSVTPAQTLVLARLDLDTLAWQAEALLAGSGSDTAAGVLRAPGSYAVVIADTLPAGNPASVVAGQPLTAGVAPVIAANVNALGAVDPATNVASLDPAKVTATATVDFTNDTQSLPSGAWFLAEVEETYDLHDGQALKTPDYDATFYAYQQPGDSSAATATARFPLRPRVLFGANELAEAHIKVNVLALSPFGGGIISQDGGLLSLSGLQIGVPTGAVSGPSAAEIRLLSTANLSPFLGDFQALMAFELNLPPLADGTALSLAITQKLAPNAHFVLARCVSSGSASGLQPVQRLRSSADGSVTSSEPASGPRLPGIASSGQHILVQITDPEALITGTVRNVGGAFLPAALVRVIDEPWLSLTNGVGTFFSLAKPGDRTVTGTDPAAGNSGQATAVLADAAATVNVEIQTVPTGPRIVSTTPTNGQQKVSAAAPITVRFSEPLDRASFVANALTVTNPLGVTIQGALTLNNAATEATFLPTSPLEHAATYTVELVASIKDRQGFEIAGSRTFSFAVIPFFDRPAGAQLVIFEPGADTIPEAVRSLLVGYDSAAGSSHVVAHGSPGTADPEVPVILVNQNSGATATVLSKPDGSFANFIDADEEDFIEAVFVNSNGTRIAVPATRQVYDNGRIGLYKFGGILEAASDGGPVQVQIEPEAIKKRSVFKLDLVSVNQLAELTGGVLPEGGGTALPSLRIEVEGEVPEGDAEVSMPLDAGTLGLDPGVAPESVGFALTVPIEIGGEVVYVTLDKMRYEDGRLFTNTCPFKGVYSASIQDNAIAFGANLIPGIGGVVAGLAQIIVPIIISKQFNGTTINGSVAQLPVTDLEEIDSAHMAQLALLPLQLFGGRTFGALDALGAVGFLVEEIKLKGAPAVQGAVVSLRRINDSFDGRIRPGTVCAVSDQNGCFSLVAPLLEGTLVATHPRLGRGRDVSLGALDLLDIGTKAFLARNIFFGINDGAPVNQTPRLRIRHTPLLPAVGEPVILHVDAFHPASVVPQFVINPAKIVLRPVVLGQQVSIEELTIQSGTPITVGPGHTSIDYTVTSAAALHATFLVLTSTQSASGVLFSETPYTVSFGFSRPVVANPLTPSDSNDRESPTVVATQPREGEFLYPGQSVRVRFSEPLDLDCLVSPGAVTFSAGSALAPALSLSADQQSLTITPRGLPGGGQVTMTLGTVLRDLAGNSLDSSVTITFFVGNVEKFVIPGVDSGSGSQLDGSVLYVLDRGNPSRVRVFDVSNPALPVAIGSFTTLDMASIGGGENAFSALDFPRDLVLIKDWSHVPGLAGVAELPETRRTLLAVVGGSVGSVFLSEAGNVQQNGQFLTILDVSHPAAPLLVANVRLTLRPSVVPRIKWEPPILFYLENSADTHFVSLIDLQELLIGFSVPAPQRPVIFKDGKAGIDHDRNGSYEPSKGEKVPWPKLEEVTEFMGFLKGYDVLPFPAQRIEDFDFGGGVLAIVRTLSGLAAPVPAASRPEFRLLLTGAEDVPVQEGVVPFEVGARPKRIALAPAVRLANGDTRNLAFVSLSPDADAVQKLAVIDWTNSAQPVLVRKIAFADELGLGSLQSPVLGEDGFLRLSTTTNVILIDPAQTFADDVGTNMHPSVLTILPFGGSSNFSIGINDSGLRSVALAGRNEVTLGPPDIRFVQFPTLAAVVDPELLRGGDPAARTLALAALQEVRSLRPARLRTAAGVPSALTPPSVLAHYHVMVRAPGGTGVTLPLLVETLNEGGGALTSQGKDYPPVRAAQSAPDLNPGGVPVAGVDAPSLPITAYRLSDDLNDPAYNLFLSDPIALIREKIQLAELAALRLEKKRVILWSDAAIRASLDVTVPGALGAFATEFDDFKGAYRTRVSSVASTLPGGYQPGSTPPPIGGNFAVPGCFGTIDGASGEFRHTTADMELPSRRMPIVFERTATNHALVSSGFGRGWDFSYNQRAIELKPEFVPPGQREPVTERGGAGKDIVGKSLDIILSDGAGNAILFENKGKTPPAGVDNDPLMSQLGWLTAGGDFYLPAAEQKGVFDLMYRFSSGEIVRLTPEGTQFHYRSDGRLSKIEDRYPDNRHLLDYNEDGDLIRIRDMAVSDGRSIRVGYYRKNAGGTTFDSTVDKLAPRDNHVGKICSLMDFVERRIEFEYDDAGMLVRRFGVDVAGANGGFSGRAQTTYQIDPQTRAYVGIIAGTGAHGGSGNNSGTPLAVAGTAANTNGEAVAQSTSGAGGPVAITVPPDRNAANVAEGSTQSSHADGSSTSVSYDANGYPATVTSSGPGAAQATYHTIHNADGLPEAIIYPEGNAIRYEYEPNSAPFRARANVRRTTRDPGPRGGPVLVSEGAYDYRYNLPAGTQKDFNGNSMTLTLRGDGRDMVLAQYPKAGTQTLAHNDFGQVVVEVAVEGISTSMSYDATTGYVEKRTVGVLETGFGYDGTIAAKLGLPSTVTLPRGAAIGMEHDARLQRTRTTRGLQDERMGYDENGNVVFVSRALGDGAAYQETREYSQINFLKKLTVKGVETGGASADLVTLFTPDSVFRIKEMTLPGGELRKLTYDHLGNVTKTETGTYKEEFGRDLHGNLTAVKKGDAIVQEVLYDGHDRPFEIRNKTGTGGDEVTALTYFGKGELKTRTVTGAVGGLVAETVVTDVDEMGRPLVTQAKGNQVNAIVTTSYTGNGGRTVTAAGPIDSFTATHDTSGRPITQVNSLRSVTMTPDANGNVERVISQEDGQSYQMDMVYNDLDQLVSTTDPLGTVMDATSLRSDGMPLVVKDGRGNSITKSYSRLGELLVLDKPEQIRFAYAYDANRQSTSVKDRSGAGNAMAHVDGTLRSTSTTWRSGATTEFNAPDGRNLPTSITIPGGNIAASYDLQGRPVALNTTYAGGPYKFENAQYDALGRLRSAGYGSSGQFSLTMGYDKLGPLTSCTYDEPGGPYTVSSTIRADGACLTLAYPSGITVTETRQNSGRLTKVAVGGDSIWEATAFAGTDLPSEVKRGASITEISAYDQRRRLLARRFTGPGNAVLEDMRFKFDAADNLMARQFMAGGGRGDMFTYDAASRLVRAEYGVRPLFQGAQRSNVTGLQGGEGFAPGWFARVHGYDGGGLDLLQGGVLANPDALPLQSAEASALAVPLFAASIGGHDSLFLFPQAVDGFARGSPDPQGNTARTQLLARPVSGLPQLVAAGLTYNAHSNLIQVQRDDGVTIDCQYRPDKLLHHRKVTGGAAPGERALVWHDGRLLEEYDLTTGNTLIARYYYANDDPPVAADLRQGDGSLLRVHYFWDQVLSVVAVADETGRILERMRYDAWGQPVITTRDEAAPRMAQVRREGEDLLIVMSEPVLPPLIDPGGEDLQPNNGNTPSQSFRLLTGSGEQTPQVVFEEDAAGLPFGSVFRLTPTGNLTGNVTVRLLSGGLVDAWGNPTPAEDLSFTFGAGPVLASGSVTAGATAPAAVPRSGIGNPWLWQGQWFDYDAGLSYMRGRHYDPITGQFLQRDPMQYEDSVNLYAGLGNNATSLRDPTGLIYVPKNADNVLAQAARLAHFAERQGLTHIEMEAIASVLGRRLDAGQEIRLSIRSLGEKAAHRRKLVLEGVQQKPSTISDKTGANALLEFTDDVTGQKRRVTSDLDALHLEIDGRMASHSETMKLFGEINLEVHMISKRLGNVPSPPFQHGAQTGMVHVYSPGHSKRFTGGKFELGPVIEGQQRTGHFKNQNKFVDDGMITKVGHPGESFTFKTSKRVGLQAYDTPHWQTHQDILTAERILMKHQMDVGLQPIGFQGTWYKWKDAQ